MFQIFGDLDITFRYMKSPFLSLSWCVRFLQFQIWAFNFFYPLFGSFNFFNLKLKRSISSISSWFLQFLQFQTRRARLLRAACKGRASCEELSREEVAVLIFKDWFFFIFLSSYIIRDIFERLFLPQYSFVQLLDPSSALGHIGTYSMSIYFTNKCQIFGFVCPGSCCVEIMKFPR